MITIVITLCLMSFRAMDRARCILKSCENSLQQAVSSLPTVEDVTETMDVTKNKEVCNSFIFLFVCLSIHLYTINNYTINNYFLISL